MKILVYLDRSNFLWPPRNIPMPMPPTHFCKMCGNPIPASIVVNGKTVYRSSRVNCFDCVPYGQGLQGPHETRLRPDRVCRECGANYTYTRNATHDLCLRCKRKRFVAKRKRLIIERLGGKCCVCGYDRCTGALECHHRDPDQKEYIIGAGYGTKLMELWKEVDKCVLLCSNCHREFHAGLINLPA